MGYEHSRNQVYLLNYHLVWCPKRRQSVLVGAIKKRLLEIFGDVAKEKRVKILACEGIVEQEVEKARLNTTASSAKESRNGVVFRL